MSMVDLSWHLVALVSIATSSLFYTWVWYRPNDWMKLCSPLDPCTRMALYAHILKAVQFTAIWMCTDKTLVMSRATNPAFLVPALVLIIFGQHLNARVYELLGSDGVYYGYRFGKNIPWRTEWPYNKLRDPQYLGASCTLLGVMVLGGPAELCLHWLGNYCYLVWLESKLPESAMV